MADSVRTGIILVVDDQEGVRGLLRRQLTDAGHTVLGPGGRPGRRATGCGRRPPRGRGCTWAGGGPAPST